MFKIKQKPGDFIVREQSEFSFLEKGKYGIFLLEKRELTTLDAIQRVASRLHIQPKEIGFAGNKDRNAITSQYVSIPSFRQNLELPEIRLTFQGFTNEPIRIGELTENQFEILVSSDKAPAKRDFLPNYFDEQRFSENNPEVGLAIVKRDFKLAVELFKKHEISFVNASESHLRDHPNDFVGAILLVPKPLLLLLVNSFQSLLFNRALDAYIRSGAKDFHEWEIAGVKCAFPNKPIAGMKLPIPGFGTRFNAKEKEVYEPLLKEYGIGLVSFINPQIKWLSQEGTAREAILPIKGLEIKKKQNDYLLSFVLPKGAYATIAVKSLF